MNLRVRRNLFFFLRGASGRDAWGFGASAAACADASSACVSPSFVASLAIAAVIAVAGCGSRTETPQKNPLDEVWTPAEEDVYPAATDVRIEPVEELGGHRYAPEVAGIAIALYETGLTDLAGVVPHYDRHGPPPGVDRWLTQDSRHWSARFSFAYDRDTLQVVLRLCPASGACKGASASGPRETPEGAITELLVWTAGQIDAPVPAGMVEAWSKPLSSDRYAVLVLGRAAASWYGIVDPVSPEERGDPNRDPLARVVLIDPSLSLAHYILARRALDVGKEGVAVTAFDRARKSTPGRFVYEVAGAAAAGSAGQWADARKDWDELDARWPDDSRFVIPRIETFLANDMPKEAQALIDELPDRFDSDPEIARLRVGVADKIGPGPDYEQLVTAWENAAEYDPEPVRRHIALRLRDGRLEEAFELLAKLEARGASAEAKQMTIALGAGIGRFEEAAKQASLAGSDQLAERLRLRAALSTSPKEAPAELLKMPDYDARLLAAKLKAATNPEQALADVRAVLAYDRFLAEAIALEVNILERLGRSDEAVQARERLQFADPAFASGPRTVAGETETGSQSQLSLAE
jgi:tetratricopeptide (TPR) repeat protein